MPSTQTDDRPQVLTMTGICKRYGAVVALDGVDFEVTRGEIHALLGVNGAGKSTLVKILSGLDTPDAGAIQIDGTSRTINSPNDSMNAGIASVQQNLELIGDFTGYENIFLGHETGNAGLFQRIDRKAMRQRASELLARLPFEIDLDAEIDTLSSVGKEIVAVLHCMQQEHIKLLILDEPTSTLTRIETEQLFRMMSLLKDAGIAIIYITHRLEEVFEIADRFTVFRAGRKIGTFRAADAREGSVSITKLMLQEEIGDLFPSKRHDDAKGVPELEVRNLTLENVFRDVSFSVSKGEIVGLFGLVGSGIDELAKAIFGALRPSAGTVVLAGTAVQFKSPRQALAAGVFLVPGDRRAEGLVLTDNVIFNTTLAGLRKASSAMGFLKFRGNRARTANLAEAVALTPPSLDRPAQAFSGGNQQKIVIAKGLFQQGSVYIFVEPTIGVDVGARLKLYALIRDLSRDAAVIVMSSDCDEIYGLGDRVSALYRGRLVSEPSADISRDALLAVGVMGRAA